MIATPVQITHAKPQDCAAVNSVIHAVWGDTYNETELQGHVRRYPQAIFMAMVEEQVVGFAITMRTNRSPQAKPLSWQDAVGAINFDNHESNGRWLYGVDFGIHPDFRKRGIGTLMYQARFKLVQRLKLRGFYAGGMLRGYEKYRQLMTVREYGEKVIAGKIKDPTVTMQINRGFKPRAVIENYAECAAANDGAVLIVWNNPLHQHTVALSAS